MIWNDITMCCFNVDSTLIEQECQSNRCLFLPSKLAPIFTGIIKKEKAI